jgi:hypothetical protein
MDAELKFGLIMMMHPLANNLEGGNNINEVYQILSRHTLK